jgi:hypothetical protein
MEASGRLQTKAALPLGNQPPYPLGRKLGGPQSGYGRCAGNKTSPCPPARGRLLCRLVPVTGR